MLKIVANKANEGKKMTVAHDSTVEAFLDEQGMMRLSVCVPDQIVTKLPPMDIVCVIDISDSMGGSATCKTDGRTAYEDLGYSLLDLVKHAVKTIINSMRPEDRISIILFHDFARVAYNFTELTDANRKELLQFTDQIRQ